jgi:acyl-coenzyme A synthetase/AMP-(fatty) acid ligase
VLDDSPAFAAAFWGAARLGAVAVPVNTLMTAAEYEFLLNDSRARVAVVEAEAAPRVLAARDRCPWLRAVFVVGGRAPGAVDWDDALARAKPPAEAAATSPEDVVYWGYTSGSTGKPKAAVHSHKDFVAAADLVGVGIFGLGADDLVFSPRSSTSPSVLGNALYFPPRVGAASVLVPSAITAESRFEVITRERPRVFTVPTLYARMLGVPTPSTGSISPRCASASRRARRCRRRCSTPGPIASASSWWKSWARPRRCTTSSPTAGPGAPRERRQGRAGFETRLVDDDGRRVRSAPPVIC